MSGAGTSTLIIRIKSNKKCKVTFVCDYFAPAKSSKHPPCCKKWRLDKVCEPKDKAPPADSEAKSTQVSWA